MIAPGASQTSGDDRKPRHKKEAAPKGGFQFVALLVGLEEDHATEHEDVQIVIAGFEMFAKVGG
ncbi:MAG: hypothetical protein ACXWJ4_03600, partial [Methyloceanibacter sp.]